MRLWVQYPASLSGSRIRRCREPWCRLQTQFRSDVAVAVGRPAAVAPTGPLAWEPPYAVGAVLKKKKKKDYETSFVAWAYRSLQGMWGKGDIKERMSSQRAVSVLCISPATERDKLVIFTSSHVRDMPKNGLYSGNLKLPKDLTCALKNYQKQEALVAPGKGSRTHRFESKLYSWQRRGRRRRSFSHGLSGQSGERN